MTNEDMRIAIAEACKWTQLTIRDNGDIIGVPPPLGVCFIGGSNTFAFVPNYPDDRNAMAEAEKTLSDYSGSEGEHYSQQDDYAEQLLKLVATWKDGFHWGSECVADFYKIATATAHQRAEAFLKTIGKWKD